MERRIDGSESLNICVCSFSEERDSLSQWRAYASKSSGFAIGFDGLFLDSVAKINKWFLAPCIYNEEEKISLVDAIINKALEEKDAEKAADHLSQYLQTYAPILKDNSFRDEREWRLISPVLSCTKPNFDYREGSSMLIPFYRLPLQNTEQKFLLHEVVIGPTPNPVQSERSVMTFLARNGIYDSPIEQSKVPYRSW
jgi:hypothetical protein